MIHRFGLWLLMPYFIVSFTAENGIIAALGDRPTALHLGRARYVPLTMQSRVRVVRSVELLSRASAIHQPTRQRASWPTLGDESPGEVIRCNPTASLFWLMSLQI